MIKILSQCQEGVFFMSKLSKELIRQIIADGEFSTPNDIGEYLDYGKINHLNLFIHLYLWMLFTTR